jgi:malonyl CoA-acyl carrier protein transacylase
MNQYPPTVRVLDEVLEERERQEAKWGQQDHPDGTGPSFESSAKTYRVRCQRAFNEFGTGTYRDILLEEVYEALVESDKSRLREELIQVAAVAVAWVEKLDRGF